MKNIITILKELGIEIPSDKTDDLNKEVAENYKTVVEFDKKVGALEKERDTFKKQSEDFEIALKDFEGKDFDGLKKELEEFKTKSAEAKKEYEKQIAERDKKDAIEKFFADKKFTSTSAEKHVKSEFEKADLKVKDGVLIGGNDLLKIIMEEDKGAFIDEEQEKREEHKARFTESKGKDRDTKKESVKDEITNIKDPIERQKAIMDNLELLRE